MCVRVLKTYEINLALYFRHIIFFFGNLFPKLEIDPRKRIGPSVYSEICSIFSVFMLGVSVGQKYPNIEARNA